MAGSRRCGGHGQCFQHDYVRLRSGTRSLCRSGNRRARCHARWPPRCDLAISCAAISQGSRRGARTPADADQPERAHLSDCSCFNLSIATHYFKLGRKLAFFGDGHQFREIRHGRRVWVVPILAGEFIIDRRFGFSDGLMGGNLWFFGETPDAALDAAERAEPRSQPRRALSRRSPAALHPAARRPAADINSRSPAPTQSSVRRCARSSEKIRLPAGVQSVMEIIINGRDLAAIGKPPTRLSKRHGRRPGY